MNREGHVTAYSSDVLKSGAVILTESEGLSIFLTLIFGCAYYIVFCEHMDLLLPFENLDYCTF